MSNLPDSISTALTNIVDLNSIVMSNFVIVTLLLSLLVAKVLYLTLKNRHFKSKKK